MNYESPRCTIIPVPEVTRLCKVICGLVNCIIPGLGLLIAACIENSPAFMWYFQIALMEFFLIFLLVGFIWGIVNGVWMIFSACKPNIEPTDNARDNGGADVVEANEQEQAAQEHGERFRGNARRL